MKKIASRIKGPKVSRITGEVSRRYVLTVEIAMYEPANHPDEFIEWFDITEEDLVEVAQWVIDHELGHRTSHNQWKLNSAEAVTMFLLRWNT